MLKALTFFLTSLLSPSKRLCYILMKIKAKNNEM